jgi:hypothetical protein
MKTSKIPKLTHSKKRTGPVPSRAAVKTVAINHGKLKSSRAPSAVAIAKVDEKTFRSSIDARLQEARNKPKIPLVDFSMLDSMQVPRDFAITAIPSTGRPEMVIQVPDAWPYIELAPLYDCHIGSGDQDEEKFLRHLQWIKNSPCVLTWNGGDMVDNATVNSVADPNDSTLDPNEQYSHAKELLLEIRHKILFAIIGNHEYRTKRLASLDVAKLFANELCIPYSRDYMFCTIRWRGLKFRLLAHHGSGGAQTPGGILNAARKDMPWAHGVDLYWSGHLHQPKSDVVSCTDFNQETDETVERDAFVIISPSYVRYFGSYAALKRLAPGVRGLTAARLEEDGRIVVTMHANGKRL